MAEERKSSGSSKRSASTRKKPAGASSKARSAKSSPAKAKSKAGSKAGGSSRKKAGGSKPTRAKAAGGTRAKGKAKQAASERPSPEKAQGKAPSGGGENGQRQQGENIAAPSVGPNTVIERKPPEERLAKHEQSDTDAMGLDKRRQVAGGSYGPSAAKQATLYGAFLVVLAALLFGAKLLTDELDAPPANYESKAPWTGNQEPPRPIDFPRNPSNDPTS